MADRPDRRERIGAFFGGADRATLNAIAMSQENEAKRITDSIYEGIRNSPQVRSLAEQREMNQRLAELAGAVAELAESASAANRAAAKEWGISRKIALATLAAAVRTSPQQSVRFGWAHRCQT